MLDHQDLTAVQTAAQRAVSAAYGCAVTISAIEHWGGGAHNSGYQLALGNGTRLFMKIEKDAIFPRTRRCQIEREVYGLRLASQAGLDVPDVIGYDFTGQVAGCRYLLEEFVDQELLGEVIERLPEEQHGPLLAAFQEKIDQVYAIRGECFGELYPGGWLGQFGSWSQMVSAFSTILLEDARTLGLYSAPDMATLQEAHAVAARAIRHNRPAILTHNDLHIYNVFTTPGDGPVMVGKLFDFGLCLLQADYLASFGPRGFDGKEAQLAQAYGVEEIELHSYSLISSLEFINFASAIRFAPDKPYGWLARRDQYLASCRSFLEAYGCRDTY